MIFLTSSIDIVAKDIAAKLPTESKLAFITTASEGKDNDKQWLEDDRKALSQAGFIVSDYTITNKTKNDVEKNLTQFDVLCFEGGNTFYLLWKIQESGCGEIIKKLVTSGKTYIGSSAGSIIAGPDIYPAYRLETVAKAPDLKDFSGLGLVDFVVLPHWGSDHFKDLYLNNRLEHTYNMDNKLILLNDNQYIETSDGKNIKMIDIKHG